jgi:hypothetical protein
VRTEGNQSLPLILDWLANPGDPGADAVRAKLREWVPEYRPGG